MWVNLFANFRRNTVDVFHFAGSSVGDLTGATIRIKGVDAVRKKFEIVWIFNAYFFIYDAYHMLDMISLHLLIFSKVKLLSMRFTSNQKKELLFEKNFFL